MKKIIIPLLVIIITGILAKYKIFADKTELKYSLSQKIDSDFLENKEEFGIQQLTVKNSGDLIISDIVIKINSKINDFKLKKFSVKDSIVAINSDSNFELNYSNLPPNGEILLLVKSNGINKDNIEIFYANGKAVEIFENDLSLEQYFFYFVIFIYLLMIINSYFKSSFYLFESEATYSSKKILEKKQPWYMNKSKWSKIREIAVNNYFDSNHYFFNKIEESSYYTFLNENDNINLTIDEKKKLRDLAFALLKKNIGSILFNSYFNKDLQLKHLKKPSSIEDHEWEEIIKNLSKVKLEVTLRDIFESKYNSLEKTENILNKEQIDLMNEEDFSKLKEILNNYYMSLILIEISRNTESYSHINWEILNQKNKEKLLDIKKIIKESEESKKYFSELINITRNSFDWSTLPDRPENIEEIDWFKIENIFENVTQLKIKANKDLKEANIIYQEFYPLKEKVSAQLELINNLLIDPKSISKVESYNIPFEKGNWENLIKISEILKIN
jgi:hypothetical protein